MQFLIFFMDDNINALKLLNFKYNIEAQFLIFFILKHNMGEYLNSMVHSPIMFLYNSFRFVNTRLRFIIALFPCISMDQGKLPFYIAKISLVMY